jgi:hypothetical protein
VVGQTRLFPDLPSKNPWFLIQRTKPIV